MVLASNYVSPIGNLLIVVKNDKLIGLWMEHQKYYKQNIKEEMVISDDNPMIVKTKKWLNRYFSGQNPSMNELNLELIGSDFRKVVWKLLIQIPYGSVTTYQIIAQKLAMIKGIKKMSAQAIGGAIGHNPILIIIPCHRVVGTNGSLTGYAGGISKKLYLLKHEKVDMRNLFLSHKGTAL